MIQWSSDYETGMPQIDEDHKRLADGLNQLEQALASGSGSKHINRLLSFLSSYATTHFAREERCMEQHRCPTAAANKAAHQDFIRKFTAAQEKIAKSSGGAAALVAIQVHRELSDWIVQHILRVDSALKRCAAPVHAPKFTTVPR